jgi:hypothetical protein
LSEQERITGRSQLNNPGYRIDAEAADPDAENVFEGAETIVNYQLTLSNP